MEPNLDTYSLKGCGALFINFREIDKVIKDFLHLYIYDTVLFL
jgi:hypothetical protein